MKRTVFGMLVMGSLVGVGSVGVYYAQGKLTPTAAAEEQSTPHENSPRRQPEPIPVSRQLAQPTPTAAVPGDPYAGNDVQDVAPARNRYADDDIPAADDHARDRYARYDAEPAADYADEIPDAESAAPSPSPFASRPAAAAPAAQPQRYPERPAQYADEGDFHADEPSADFGEPRRLESDEPMEAPRAVGNPLRGRFDDDHANVPQTQTPAEHYGGEAFPVNSGGPNAFDHYETQSVPAAAPLAATHDRATEGTGRPGDPQLNGAQSPAVTIEKTAPPEIQIGKPASFTIKVRNVGTAAAHEVEVHDAIPQGTQLLDTQPPANRGAAGQLVWSLGTLKPGDEQNLELQLMPTDEGEIGSVATVHFQAQASVRTLATRPMLNIEVLGPSKVHQGEQLTLRIKLSNPGSGAANGIMISELVPDGLSHPAGRELEFELGTLKPGETRELDLALNATEPGHVVNIIRAEGDASLKAEAQTEIEVVAPLLEVALSGPKLRYLERNATHSISVTNPGTASAKNIDLVAVLPRNLKFVEANNGGQFDEATHAVYWNLEELPPQETGTVKLTTLPLEAGDAKLLIKGMSQSGLKDEREEVVTIEGLAAINFQISDVKDPIEVGGDTAYEVRVTNQGTKAASNVRVAVLVPRGMKPLTAEAPVRYQIEGQRVLFEPLRQLAPKADTVYTIKVQATAVGDQRVQVQLVTDEIRDPISKEESTRVYGDE